MQTLAIIISAAAKLSMTQALNEEIVRSGNNGIINIMRDARHKCRKNSYRTNIPALGQITHKIVAYEHVTKKDDHATQRHENIGFSRIKVLKSEILPIIEILASTSMLNITKKKLKTQIKNGTLPSLYQLV